MNEDIKKLEKRKIEKLKNNNPEEYERLNKEFKNNNKRIRRKSIYKYMISTLIVSLSLFLILKLVGVIPVWLCLFIGFILVPFVKNKL
tara:strand:+ start:38 stop:301 length:264 start_codon:yes stop_codon:yes gene_type:complete